MEKTLSKTWNFDNVLVEFFNAAKERRAAPDKTTLALFRKNDTPLVDELERQARWRSYSGRMPLSQHDYPFGIYYNVVHDAVRKKRRNVARELLAPLARALITDDDPRGRASLADIEDPGLACQILVLFLRTDFDDGLCALLGAILLKFWDTLDTAFTDTCWRVVGASALRLERPELAAHAFLRAARLDRDPESRHDSYFEASRSVLLALRELPEDPARCRYLQGILDACAGNLDDNAQFRVLRGLLKVWTAQQAGEEAGDATDLLAAAVERASEEWDEELGGEEAALTAVAPAVKAPLEWQASLAAFFGDMRRAIRSFPMPVYADGDVADFLPAANYVNGLVCRDVFDGLPVALGDTSAAALRALWAGTEATRQVESRYVCQTGLPPVAKYELRQSPDRAACDLSVLCVATRPVADKGRAWKREMCFPFPAKDNPANGANATGRPWEYFIWRRGIAADARIELASGRHVYATLPFFAHDVTALVRGFSSTLLLAAFPLTLRKAARASGSEGLRQDVGDPRFTRAAAEIVARVVADAPATLWNGRTVHKYLLGVPDLGFDLPAFVGDEVIEGEPPQPGDLVSCRAWLMADFRDAAESFEAFRRKHAEGVTVKPAPVEKDADGKREEEGTFLLECAVAGTSHVEDAAGKTAELGRDSPIFLRREPGNAYDRDAIAVYTAEENRIGYVPQQHNPILSRLLDGGRTLVGRVASREVVNDYVKMRICIYLR